MPLPRLSLLSPISPQCLASGVRAICSTTLPARCGRPLVFSASSRPFSSQQMSTRTPEVSGPTAMSARMTRCLAARTSSRKPPASDGAPRRDRSAGAYVRSRDLPRLLALWPHEIEDQTAEGGTRLLAKLRRARSNHWSYDLNRHLGLLRAYQGELVNLRVKSIGTRPNCTRCDSRTG